MTENGNFFNLDHVVMARRVMTMHESDIVEPLFEIRLTPDRDNKVTFVLGRNDTDRLDRILVEMSK